MSKVVLAGPGAGRNFFSYLLQDYYGYKDSKTLISPEFNEYLIPYVFRKGASPGQFAWDIKDKRWVDHTLDDPFSDPEYFNAHVYEKGVFLKKHQFYIILHRTHESALDCRMLAHYKRGFGASSVPREWFTSTVDIYLNCLKSPALILENIDKWKEWVGIVKRDYADYVIPTGYMSTEYFLRAAFLRNEPFQDSRFKKYCRDKTEGYHISCNSVELKNMLDSNLKQAVEAGVDITPVYYEDLMEGKKTGTLFDNYSDKIIEYDYLNKELVKKYKSFMYD